MCWPAFARQERPCPDRDDRDVLRRSRGGVGSRIQLPCGRRTRAEFIRVESSGDSTESLGELSRIVQYLPAAVVPDDVPGPRMPVEIDWSAILEFIARRDVEIANSCAGVARSQIEAIESQCEIALPSNYVNFLQTMGESSGGLNLFGFTYAHQFSRLVRQLPSTSDLTQRYFRVAMESDPAAPAFEDIYLDLQRSDQHDGPLVRISRPLNPDSEFEEGPLSVTERIIYELVWELDVSRMPFGAGVVAVEGGASRNPQKTKEDAADVVRGVGFAASLPELPRVACMAQPMSSVLISIDDDLVRFELGGDSREAVEGAVNALLLAQVGADLQEPPARRIR